MNLTQYSESLRRELMIAAEAGGSDAVALAERLTAPLESASRLVLLEVLSAAASEITAELAPGAVDVRLRGRDPEFVVTSPAAPQALDDVEDSPTSDAIGPIGEISDGGTSRMTLRLPEQLKLRIEGIAARKGASVNAWLVRALSSAVALSDRERPSRRRSPPGGQHYTGWVR